ncbi:MAG: 5-(carboxyamino)imidazole ribonucleotide synthase [Planctomycetes bacterium]|nr:5-(carboxyamino)imidazole ribonucleotide synthase [Planctomycetota bacterium]
MNVGILGGGQLGRMLALAGHALGIRTLVLENSAECPAVNVTDVLVGAFENRGDLERIAAASTVVTYEFENVPIEAARYLAQRVSVCPPPQALECAQDRLIEKTTFQSLGIPTPQFADVDSIDGLREAVARIGLPAVLKTRRLGYDGKGQRVLRAPGDVDVAWAALRRAHDLGRVCAFDREVAIIAVRSRDGSHAFYPLVETRQEGGILHTAIAPEPRWSQALQTNAETYAMRLLDHLDYVGVLALELFEHNGGLLGNEFAPRVHNSGHWTIEGAETSQFENHLRAILGLPLGSTAAIGHVGMVNLIGTLPPISAILAIPHARVHLYGKRERSGRKLGHVTVRAENGAELIVRLDRVIAVVKEAERAAEIAD